MLELEASRAERNEYPAPRSLASRVCYCNIAAKQWGPMKANALIVPRGYRDTDLPMLRRGAPATTLAGCYLVLVTARHVGLNRLGVDTTGGFMQGGQDLAQRDFSFFLTQPRRGLPGFHGHPASSRRPRRLRAGEQPPPGAEELEGPLPPPRSQAALAGLAAFVVYDVIEEICQPVFILGVHVDDLLGGYASLSARASDLMEMLQGIFEFGS